MHRCYRVSIGGALRFLKTNDARHAEVLRAEADGLAALRAAGASAPRPLAQGVAGSDAYLLLEYLELRDGGDFAALGSALAALHRNAGERYGWHRDNYIGTTPQPNGWDDDWPRFWLERRLRPQLALARRNGFRLPEPGVAALAGHRPAPSLLHGDLWRGNAAFSAVGPVLFDPAVYYGDRETDLAMSELFGGFPPAFYEAYGRTTRSRPATSSASRSTTCTTC